MASIQSNVTSGQEKLTEAKQKMSEKVNGATERATEKMSETFQHMRHMLYDAGHNIQEQSEQLYDSMAKYVRENPLKAIGVAALAGGVLAILLRKMSD
jgi:ElaB/YqjD/DUF883 family membrane-anchored ribosome-binding protein